jgi:hypothetical protein
MIIEMSKREQAMKPTSQKYKRYKEWLDRKSPVEWKTVFSRLNRESDMLRGGRTLDEIYMQPANTKLIHSKNSKKLH